MKPVVILDPGVFVPASVAAAIAPTLTRALSDAQRLGAYVDPDVRETIERLAVIGAGWANRNRTVPTMVPLLDEMGSDPSECLTVAETAEVLGITERAVRKRLARSALPGWKDRGVWRVDSRAVEAACR